MIIVQLPYRQAQPHVAQQPLAAWFCQTRPDHHKGKGWLARQGCRAKVVERRGGVRDAAPAHESGWHRERCRAGSIRTDKVGRGRLQGIAYANDKQIKRLSAAQYGNNERRRPDGGHHGRKRHEGDSAMSYEQIVVAQRKAYG